MTKQRKVNIALIAIAATAVGALSISTITNLSATSQSSTNIQVTFNITAPSFGLNNIYINGQNKQEIVTHSANNTLEFDAIGMGTITLTDANGLELYSVTKTTVGQAHYYVRFELGSVGLHELTLRMAASESEFIDAQIAIDFRPLPLPPNTGIKLSDQAGYSYLGGYAINNIDAVLLAVILTAVAVIVFFLVHQSQEEKVATTASPRLPKTRVIKSKAKIKRQTGRKARVSNRSRKS